MEKFTKKHAIASLKEGDRIDDIFVVKIKKGLIQYAKGFAFELILSDSSGKSLEYKYWGSQDKDKVKALYDSIKPDCIVHVQGVVSSYKGKLQLTTNEPDKIEVLEKGQYAESDFIKPAKKNVDEMYVELLNAIDSVENKKLKAMLNSIFGTDEIEKKLKVHAGAIEMHHNWIGGLLQHMLEVLEFCKKAHELFPQLDRDLLMAGALLHDLGKLEEIEMTSRIKSTTKGQLLGHIILTAIFVSKKCDEAGLDEMTKNKLLHIIASHHGKYEQGSPKEPAFPEALAIYYADEMSAKLADLIEFIENSKNDTNDEFMFHDRIKRNILLR